MCAGKHGSLGIYVRETRYPGETYITVTADLGGGLLGAEAHTPSL